MWSGLAANGASEGFPLRSSSDSLEVASVVISIDSTDTLTVYADVEDDNGDWIQVAALPAQTAAGVQTLGVPSLAAINGSLLPQARLRWTTTSGTAVVLLAAVSR